MLGREIQVVNGKNTLVRNGFRTGWMSQLGGEVTRAASKTGSMAKKQIPMCSLQPWTCSQVQVLPRQWMVGPRSDSRLRLGETPVEASSARTGPSWTEFVRPAHQAVVAFAGADMTNRAEPRACGHSREPIPPDSEPEAERNAGSASNAAGDGGGRARSDQAGFQPYWGKPAVRNDKRGWRKRGQDLMAICHDARKGRHTGSHWSKPVAPPLHSTSSNSLTRFFWKGCRLSGTLACRCNDDG